MTGPTGDNQLKTFSHYSLGTQKITEKALVERAKTDSAAFGILYDIYLGQIYGFILKRVGNVAVAEDITSLTFEKALRKLKDFHWQNVSFGAWLYTIAANAVTDHFRENVRKQKVDLDSVPEIKDGRQSLEAEVSQKIFFENVRNLLPSLDEPDQTVLTLKLFSEKSNQEICQVVGLSKAHVAVRIHRALKKLRQELRERGIDYY